MSPLPASEVSWKSGGSVAEKLVFLKKLRFRCNYLEGERAHVSGVKPVQIVINL